MEDGEVTVRVQFEDNAARLVHVHVVVQQNEIPSDRESPLKRDHKETDAGASFVCERTKVVLVNHKDAVRECLLSTDSAVRRLVDI